MDTPTLPPTSLSVSGERLVAIYELRGNADRAEQIMAQLVVEQTIEFPLELVPDDDIRGEVVARVEHVEDVAADRRRAHVSYAIEVVGGQLPQLLNVLFGNISLVPGVRLIDVTLPRSCRTFLPGPRLGVHGVRSLIGHDGPVLASALKPLGTPVPRLADMAAALAAGGIDLIKDDHSLATQPFATFEERVPALAAAVRRGSAHREAPARYLPALNLPGDRLREGVELAVAAGAGGLLVLPGLHGFDLLRWLTDVTPEDFVLMAHPSLLGSHVTDPTGGMSHALVLGALPRLAGADVCVFPNFGGRFTFSAATCGAVATACTGPRGDWSPALPAPAGGMALNRVPAMREAYGDDVCLLIGGALYRGDIREQAARFAAASRRSGAATTREEPHHD